MISNLLFIGLCVLALIAFALWVGHLAASQRALSDVSLAFLRFSGEHSRLFLQAETGGSVLRASLSIEEEQLCEQLEEVGLFSELPGAWILTASGQKAISSYPNFPRKIASGANT